MASGRQRLTKGPRPNTTGRPDKRYGARNAHKLQELVKQLQLANVKKVEFV